MFFSLSALVANKALYNVVHRVYKTLRNEQFYSFYGCRRVTTTTLSMHEVHAGALFCGWLVLVLRELRFTRRRPYILYRKG